MAGVKNTIGDLTNHLFAELERLGDESLTPEELEREIDRSKAITGVAQQVIANANTLLRAVEFQDGRMASGDLPRMLTSGD